MVGLPCVTDAVREDTSPYFTEYLQQADGPEVLYVGELVGFGEGDQPALFPEVGDVLGWPQGAEHVIGCSVEVVWECFEVAVGEARDAWSSVFLMRLDGE